MIWGVIMSASAETAAQSIQTRKNIRLPFRKKPISPIRLLLFFCPLIILSFP